MRENKIELKIKQDLIISQHFLGAFAFDELPINLSYPSSFIINTKPRINEGEHWLALFYDKNKVCYFFDSYGFSPNYHRLTNYIRTTSAKFNYNKNVLQEMGSTVCGEYCIMFLYYISRNDLYSFYKKFSNKVKNNDLNVKLLFNKHF